ncbi:MAG: GAF domain-containing protein [Gammaproteobacteria bacterium]|nr:GAF domain-containing protein [Gammaproteobacteria bacterium]
MTASLREIAHCFEGGIPSGIATCSSAGVVNVTYLSQVHLIDDQHIGLSYQFFNKTRANLAENPNASLLVIDPFSGIQYRLAIRFQRTDTEGPHFDKLKVKLAAVASMSGMSDVFHLRGVDVFQVLSWECMELDATAQVPRSTVSFAELNEVTQAISDCDQLAHLLDTTLSAIATHLGYTHSMILFFNNDGESLYTIASHGYQQQGAGAEVALGEGIVGTVAEQGRPVKISNMRRENIMADAVRQQARNENADYVFRQRIALPGLSNPNSQLAVPIEAKNRKLGVLFLESEKYSGFSHDMQELICSVANHLGTAILLCDDEPREQTKAKMYSHIASTESQKEAIAVSGLMKVRYYQADKSIFIDNDYLIKGVAGSILFRLLTLYLDSGRSEFTNRELRLDEQLGLPEIADNLEARLVLLQRRLDDRCPGITMQKTGRGRFSLHVERKIDLLSVAQSN